MTTQTSNIDDYVFSKNDIIITMLIVSDIAHLELFSFSFI